MRIAGGRGTEPLRGEGEGRACDVITRARPETERAAVEAIVALGEIVQYRSDATQVVRTDQVPASIERLRSLNVMRDRFAS